MKGKESEGAKAMTRDGRLPMTRSAVKTSGTSLTMVVHAPLHRAHMIVLAQTKVQLLLFNAIILILILVQIPLPPPWSKLEVLPPFTGVEASSTSLVAASSPG